MPGLGKDEDEDFDRDLAAGAISCMALRWSSHVVSVKAGVKDDIEELEATVCISKAGGDEHVGDIFSATNTLELTGLVETFPREQTDFEGRDGITFNVTRLSLAPVVPGETPGLVSLGKMLGVLG